MFTCITTLSFKEKFTGEGFEPATWLCRRSTNWANSLYNGQSPYFVNTFVQGGKGGSGVIQPYNVL